MPSGFTLLGHDCPYGQYPAPVIPVGRLEGALVAVYPGGDPGPTVEQLDEDEVHFIIHGPPLARALRTFDYRVHRLFAYGPHDVLCYPARQEKQFYRDFLKTPKSLECSLALRSMLEKYAGDSRRTGSRNACRARVGA